MYTCSGASGDGDEGSVVLVRLIQHIFAVADPVGSEECPQSSSLDSFGQVGDASANDIEGGDGTIVLRVMNEVRPPTTPAKSADGLSYGGIWDLAVKGWNSDRAMRPSMRDFHQALSGLHVPSNNLTSKSRPFWMTFERIR